MRRLLGLILLSLFLGYPLISAVPFAVTSLFLAGTGGDLKNDFAQAREMINNNQYQDAIPVLMRLLKEDPQNSNLNFLVGYCYYHLDSEKNKALPYFEKAIVSTIADYDDNSPREKSAPVYAFYYLGKCYHGAGRLQPALSNLQQFRGYLVDKSDNLINQKNLEIFSEVNNAIQQVKTAQQLIGNALRLEFLKIPLVNTASYSCYGAQLTGDRNALYYSRERMNDKLRGKSDMYVLKKAGDIWMKNEQAGQNLNGPYNDIFNSVSPDGKFLLYSSDRKGVYNVFYSVQDNNKWTEPFDNLSINSNFNESAAVLSADGNRMFFVSDRPGGFGGKDLYSIEKKSDGSWTQPVNLGFVINTSKDEDTPWLSDDGKRLFFSSSGHAGMGGYDIFFSDYRNNMWTEPVNAGFPVNSVANDMYFRYYHDNNLLLFSSNRKSGGIAYEILGARYLDSTAVVEIFTTKEDVALAGLQEPEQPVVREEQALFIQLPADTVAAGRTSQKEIPSAGETKRDMGKTAFAPQSEKEKKAVQDSILKVRQKFISDSLAAVRLAAVRKEGRAGQAQATGQGAQARQDSLARAQEQQRKKALAQATQEKLRLLREKARNDSIVKAKRVDDSLKVASAKLAAQLKFQQSQQQAALQEYDSAASAKIVAADSARTIKETIALQQKINDSLTRVKRRTDSLNLALSVEADRKRKEQERISQALVLESEKMKEEQKKAQQTVERDRKDSLEAADIKTREIALSEVKKQDVAVFQPEPPAPEAKKTVVAEKKITGKAEAVKQTVFKTPAATETMRPCLTLAEDTVKRYTVQVGAGWMKIKYFKSIDQKKICYGPDGMARFIVGIYSSRSEAEQAARELRALGFTDAWVPAVDEQRCLCPDKELLPQQEQYTAAAEEKTEDSMARFTVQVGAGNMKVKYFRALKQVNACTGKDGLTRFTFGVFSSLQEAVTMRDKIRTMGFHDAWTPAIDENRCGVGSLR